MAVNQQPILIAGPPRCGTTMLAGLIAPHGVWVGRARTTWYPGTNSEFPAENQDIKDVMKRLAAGVSYRNWSTPLPKQLDFWPGVKQEIEAFVPEDEPWLVKTTWTVIWWRFWNQAYPNAHWVLPQRPVDSVMNSIRRHPRMARRPAVMSRRFIEAIYARQEELMESVHYAYCFSVLKIAKGDTEEIDRLFKFIGIKPNWTHINRWIQPERMIA